MGNEEAYMHWIDWAILVIPVMLVIFTGWRTRKYIRGVSDYLSCGRLCGRYVLNMGDTANALSIIGLVAYVEMKYKTGFSLSFWGNALIPLTVVCSLTGYCLYRFRETKAMSLGQFLEIRYSRRIRVFGAALRSLAEMLANMIMPAVAARFFMQMLNLPTHFSLFGLVNVPMYDFLMILFLTIAISLLCFGGTLAIVITGTLQAMFLYPLTLMLICFILYKFSWSNEIMPTVMDRVAGESFINPYDISKLRDFNFFSMVIVVGFNVIFHTATWIGSGTSSAAKSAHEQKMASILGNWSLQLMNILYLLIAVCLITFLNHKDFAVEANSVRQTLSSRSAAEVISNPETLEKVQKTIAEAPPIYHEIGNPPLSQAENLDTAFLDRIHKTLTDDARERTERALVSQNGGKELTEAQLASSEVQSKFNYAQGEANDSFQQVRTLFNQLNLSVTMRHLLPTGLFGAFCLLLFLAMLSTDDCRIFSATLTLAQDVILPLFPKGLSPRKHIWMVRWVAIGIGVFFYFGSKYMSQMDYIQLFNQMAVAIWNAGCPAVMVLGLYWKKGTTKAAWATLLTGILLSVAYILIQRNWANYVYPFLTDHNMVESVGSALSAFSSPFGDWIKWEMDPVKFPINAFEFLFFANIFTILFYIVVSLITCKEDFNMDRMLHRGKYSEAGVPKPAKQSWRPGAILKSLIGITPQHTLGDKAISYGVFTYNFIFTFCFCFLGVLIWNKISPWPIEYWGRYFFITQLLVPLIIAIFSTFWFGIGGAVGLFKLFRDMEARTNTNVLDDGRVSGHVSLADQAQVDKVEGREHSENKD